MAAYDTIRSTRNYDVLEAPMPGVRVHDWREGYRGSRFQFFVYDPKVRKYLSDRFKTKREAEDWAKIKFSEVRTDQARAGRFTLAQVIPQYLAFLRGEGGGDGHLNEVERVLKGAVAAGVKDLKSDGVSAAINAWISGRTDQRCDDHRPLSAHTRYRHAGHFRSLGRWLVDTADGFAKNPFRGVALPSKPKKTMPAFSPDEMARMVAKCWTTKAGAPNEEGRFFITAAYTGNRCGELAWLRWSHLMWAAKRIRVSLPDARDQEELLRLDGEAKLALAKRRGLRPVCGGGKAKHVKNNKERLAIFMDELMELLKPEARVNDEYVFGDWARRCTATTMNRALRRVCVDAGITIGKRHVHHTRSTNGATLLAAGLDAIRLQGHLGHATLEMTAHYAAAADSMAEQCRGWNGQIRWRLLSKNCPKDGDKQGRSEASGGRGEADAAESDDDDCIVIVPDSSALYRETFLKATGTDCRSAPSAMGSRISYISEASYSQVIEESDDETGCPT